MSLSDPARASDDLVPIRIDLNVRGSPVTEYFTWDLTENSVSPTDFATILVADLALPQQSIPTIAASITDQIDAVVALRQAQKSGTSVAESRQVLRLNLRIGRVVLRDQFEWDLADKNNCPEAFAESLCADLGLGREFVPAVACSVRSQLLELLDSESQRAVCRALDSGTVFRSVDSAASWGPVVERLSVSQQEYLELKERREARLARRNRSRTPGYEKPFGPIGKITSGLTRPYRRRSISE